ncbi:hypothetical protein AGMMS49975_01120 [Clostridia bacterium]|nr:hypothetical protein AGMMS49975_01120 [Clostridia bacterium]
MKRFKIDKEYMKKALYVLFVIFCAILFEKLLSHFDVIGTSIESFFVRLRVILSPFMWGFFIAYLMNPVVRWLEGKIFKLLPKKQKISRFLSVFMCFLVLIGSIVLIINYIIPEMIQSVLTLIDGIRHSRFYDIRSSFYTETLPQINETFGINFTYQQVFDAIINPVMNTLSNFPIIFNKILASAQLIVRVLLNFIMGVMVAFYMLLDKESFQVTIKKLLMMMFKKPMVQKIIYVASNSSTVFEKFVVGKAIDSLIIGLIFFVTAQFIKPPFPLFLSLIIGVTNMIPYFGPFIGAVPVILITLIDNPARAVPIGIAILIIQQFDGIILGPKILGDSTGLKPLDVIFAIIVGGALFGVIGMFAGVPVYAVIKTALSSALDKQYGKKYLITGGDSNGAATDG